MACDWASFPSAWQKKRKTQEKRATARLPRLSKEGLCCIKPWLHAGKWGSLPACGCGHVLLSCGCGYGVLSCALAKTLSDQRFWASGSHLVSAFPLVMRTRASPGGLRPRSPPASARRTLVGHPWFVNPGLAGGGGLKSPLLTPIGMQPLVDGPQKV